MEYKIGDHVEVLKSDGPDFIVITEVRDPLIFVAPYKGNDEMSYFESKEQAEKSESIYGHIVDYGYDRHLRYPTIYTDEWTRKPEEDGNLISPERISKLRNELLSIAGNMSHGEYMHHGEQKLCFTCESFTYVNGIIELHNARIIPEDLLARNLATKARN